MTLSPLPYIQCERRTNKNEKKGFFLGGGGGGGGGGAIPLKLSTKTLIHILYAESQANE